MLRTLLLIHDGGLEKSVRVCLENYGPEVSLLAATSRVTEGVELFAQLKPDLVVVSECLADGSGMQFLRMTGTRECDRVFLCQSEENWLEAIRYGAVLSQISGQDMGKDFLHSAIGHVVRRRGRTLSDRCAGYFASFAVNSLEHLALPTRAGIRWVPVSEVERVVPVGRAVEVVTTREVLQVQRSLAQMRRVLLPIGFERMEDGSLRKIRTHC